ncbi:OprD family porin [Pseudomonas sp. MHK4]
MHVKQLCWCSSSGALLVTLLASPAVRAEFVQQSHASLLTRNFYLNRDFRQAGAPQNLSAEWAQGFILRAESGYTDGAVGLGVDALGLLGVKLDSSPGRSGGTGLLQRDRETRRAEDEYGELGLTARLKVSNSVLKVGTLTPLLPLVMFNDTRLLPQTFEGAWLNSTELDGLTLDLGQLRQVNQRDSSDNESLTASRTTPGLKSDRFDFVGGNYKWTPGLSTGLHYGILEDVYKQLVATLVHSWPIAPGHALRTDLRWSHESADGSASEVDNRALGAAVTYSYQAHRFGFYYQQMDGDTGFAYLTATNPYLVNLLQVSDFGSAKERSYQLRYDYDFAASGLPGLTFMTRYVQGKNVEVSARAEDGREWERDTDIAYAIQSGPLKNLSLLWRNASARSDFGSDIDENRLILSYSLALW